MKEVTKMVESLTAMEKAIDELKKDLAVLPQPNVLTGTMVKRSIMVLEKKVKNLRTEYDKYWTVYCLPKLMQTPTPEEDKTMTEKIFKAIGRERI
jgi:hypothetical protein